MRILIPAYSFYPSQEGGPSNAIYWLASGLANVGYEVRVVATNRCQKPGAVIENTWLRLNGFDVVYATPNSQMKYLRQELPFCDVLIANGVCRICEFFFNLKAICANKRVILSPRGELLDPAIFHKGKAYGLLKRLVFFFMRIAYEHKIVFHATSAEEVKSIRKYMGLKANVVLIPNYMILPDRINAEFEGPQYLLYVGRLNHIKNIDIIIDGLAQSSIFRTNDVKFKLAGEKTGAYYESLKKQVKTLELSDKVEFLGLVTGDEKDRLYAGAKCLLLMSKSENFGNVIVESLSQGTPVIASRGTPWKQLEVKGIGYWIDANAKQVTETVENLLLMGDADYKAMRERAYAYSREFDIYTNINQWIKVL